MAFSIDEIENFFFRFLAGELPLKEFEQWLYSTSEIENYFGASAYLELISFNFRQTAANYEFSKLIYKHVTPAQFHNWQIKWLLKNLLDGTQDPVDILENLYILYRHKDYQFLSNIGIQYVLVIDEIPRLAAQNICDENELSIRRKMLDDYLVPLKEEVQILLQALETGEIKITEEREYFIAPELSEKLKNLHKVKQNIEFKQAVIHKKPWWKFW